MCIKQPTIAYFAEATTPNIPSKNSDADKNTGKSPDAHQNFSVHGYCSHDHSKLPPGVTQSVKVDVQRVRSGLNPCDEGLRSIFHHCVIRSVVC